MRELLEKLADHSAGLDARQEWPVRQFELLARQDVLGWVIPREYGGSSIGEEELLAGYVNLAAACLTTTFVLTQRNGACQRIAASQNDWLKSTLLPPLARGELFATVGISHLTTSRQHLHVPAVQVVEEADGYRFSGDVPWVTGAAHADYLVTGGTLSDGRQVLAAISAKLPGVTIGAPARLLALGASHTSPVRLDNVLVEKKFLVAGPVEQVMRQGASSTGSLGTSALATGLSRAALRHLSSEAAARPDLAPLIQPLVDECLSLETAISQAAGRTGVANDPALSPEVIRTRANSLALRSTQALLAASKGAGFVSGHFAERAVREAMFFLVWSCPQPVVKAALRELAGLSTC
ncbi:MAG TPA: acyl-CoA dehydrogenase family protein [Planctomycetaceae bacterium]|jgi:alkylation response protein AidB-like acyl-CoA dehydrogenase